MIGWLNLADGQRRTSIAQAATIIGARENVVEKDWWVTLILKALFTGPYADGIVFKGGTSLSKCYKLIFRFSEDVDIVLDPRLFGMEYNESPSRSYLSRLKRQGCEFTSNRLKQSIQETLETMGVDVGKLSIYPEDIPASMPDKDPQVLFVEYPSLYEKMDEYVPNRVKIEAGVRSKMEPFTTAVVQSLLNEFFPNKVYGEEPFELRVVEARKTFIEKIFLLHEELKKPDRSKIRTERMSRHYYDLERMMDTDVFEHALADSTLYESIIRHRSVYNKMPGIDYTLLARQTIDILPDEELLKAFVTDYERMRPEMIYGNPLNSKDLFDRIKLLQDKIRDMR